MQGRRHGRGRGHDRLWLKESSPLHSNPTTSRMARCQKGTRFRCRKVSAECLKGTCKVGLTNSLSRKGSDRSWKRYTLDVHVIPEGTFRCASCRNGYFSWCERAVRCSEGTSAGCSRGTQSVLFRAKGSSRGTCG